MGPYRRRGKQSSRWKIPERQYFEIHGREMKRALLLIVAAAFARAESGTFTIHMILHAIGEEKWDLTNFVLTTTTEQSDRGNKRTTTATLKLDAKYAPLSFERGAN